MRLSKVTKDYNVSLQRVVAVLQEHGVAVEPNLNSKIDDKYAELFAEKFGADKARKDQAEKQFQGRRVEKQQALEQARIEREAEKAAEKAEQLGTYYGHTYCIYKENKPKKETIERQEGDKKIVETREIPGEAMLLEVITVDENGVTIR